MDKPMTVCPVCTLYLREGVTLQAHLNTHPKDQVIEALLKVSGEAAESLETPTTSTSSKEPAQSSVDSTASSKSQNTPSNPQSHITTAVTYQHFMSSNGSAVMPQYIHVPTIINPNTNAAEDVPNPPVNYSQTMYNPIYNPFIPHPYPFTHPIYASYPMSALPGKDIKNQSNNSSNQISNSSNQTVTKPSVIVKKCTVATSTELDKKIYKGPRMKVKSSVILRKLKQRSNESRVTVKHLLRKSISASRRGSLKKSMRKAGRQKRTEKKCSSTNSTIISPPPLTPKTGATKRSLTGTTPPPPPLSKAPCFNSSETLTYVKSENVVECTESVSSAISTESSSDDIYIEPQQKLNTVIVNPSTLIQNSNNKRECRRSLENSFESKKTAEEVRKNERFIRESIETTDLEEYNENQEMVFHMIEIEEECKIDISEYDEAASNDRENFLDDSELGQEGLETERGKSVEQIEKTCLESQKEFGFHNKQGRNSKNEMKEGSLSKTPEVQSVTYTDLQPAKSSRVFQDLGLSSSVDFNNFMEVDGIKIFFNNATPAPPFDPLVKPTTKLKTDGKKEEDSMKIENPVGNHTLVDSVIQMVSGNESKKELTFRDNYNPTTSHDLHLDLPNLSPTALNIQADESMPARGELSEQESLGAENSTWSLFHGNSAGHLKSLEDWRNESVSIIGSKKIEKSFKCSICNEVFSCPKERRVHKNTIHLNKKKQDTAKKTKNYVCNFCCEIFTSLKERKAHAAEAHPTDPKNKKSNQIKQENSEIEIVNLNISPRHFLKSEEGVQNLKTETSLSPDESHRVKYCTRCSLPFVGLKKLREHLRLSHGEIRFKCETCLACFDEETEYNDHLLVHPLVCDKCGKMFHKKPNLNLHMKRHLEVKPYTCTLCPKSFVTRQKLEEHMNGHSGKKPLKCTLCDKTFSRHSNLIQHKNLHHLNMKKKIKDFVCRCGEVFHSLRKLEWHKEIHEPRPKPCPFCSQKFIHSASVTRHIRRAHLPEYLPGDNREFDNVQCPICEKIYLRSSLVVHMRVHNGEKPFACQICNKRFSTKWNLELHTWTHQSRSNMPFKCQVCKSAFFRETDFIAHLNAHRNYKPFTCNICGQKFIRKYSCLRHQEEHKKTKQFVCAVTGCAKSFHRGYYLKDHMKVHTGVRPHTCHICGKASSTKSNHNKHIRIHDTREPVNTEN